MTAAPFWAHACATAITPWPSSPGPSHPSFHRMLSQVCAMPRRPSGSRQWLQHQTLPLAPSPTALTPTKKPPTLPPCAHSTHLWYICHIAQPVANGSSIKLARPKRQVQSIALHPLHARLAAARRGGFGVGESRDASGEWEHCSWH